MFVGEFEETRVYYRSAVVRWQMKKMTSAMTNSLSNLSVYKESLKSHISFAVLVKSNFRSTYFKTGGKLKRI